MKGLVDTGENHHTEINAEGSNSEVGVIGVFVGGAKDSNQYASFTTSRKFRPAGHGSKKNFGFLLSYHRSKEKRDTHECVSLCWRYLSFRAVASQVLSAGTSLTTVFGMGTGGPSP